VDVVLPNSLMTANLLYANGMDLSHSYLSPLFGRFSDGFPATFIQSGTRDLFLSNAVRLHRALRRENISAELHVFEAMPHGGFGGTPEDAELSEEVARFVRDNLMSARPSPSYAKTCADDVPQ
ncbi:MAG: alpha/beta hydrolase fold domain-containing protein, partial [Rhodospirillaceae bacterium]